MVKEKAKRGEQQKQTEHAGMSRNHQLIFCRFMSKKENLVGSKALSKSRDVERRLFRDCTGRAMPVLS
jgi:hypothetical protein